MEVIMKKAFLALFFLAAWSLVLGAQEEIQPNITSVPVRVTVDPSVVIGPIKPMNAVNNGPYIDDRQQMQDFRVLHIPFSRTHDANEGYYGRNLVDISAVFPDFSKDPDKPASYDFRETDAYIRTLVESGSEPFYRLGQTIENQTAAKYNIYPPKDYKKWASICEHIILHYNEGWAQGFHYNIRYWERGRPGPGFRPMEDRTAHLGGACGGISQALRRGGQAPQGAFPAAEDRRSLLLPHPGHQDLFPAVLPIHAG